MNAEKYFYINGQKFNYTLEFQNTHINNYWKHNAPLIEYCETIGVVIPHYCYHKDLSISGNCRMCLVELKNSPKPMVSCAMSAKSCLNNSEIFTESPLVKKARENVLEFLLLNHPLDCPICDQGGECDLQDQSLYFGNSKKRFYSFKRIVTDKNIGPIVKTVMTRCIHCTRCVRFSAEIAGTEDLGMFGRGLDSEIGTYVNKTFQSELSGNVIDLCPVGALTAKPYPFLSRSWELKSTETIDFSDGFGTNIQAHIKNNKIIKITPSYEPDSNSNNWISDKTRFSFDGMFSPSRSVLGSISYKTDTLISKISWKELINEITITLYFQDHLQKHFLTNKKLIVVFDNNISLEVLNLIYLFSCKYSSFITLRKLEGKLNNMDINSNFLTHNKKDLKKSLINSNLCLLVGLYSRYENVTFNLNLRQRYLKGNLKVLTLGPNKDLTFPSLNAGLNIKNLKSIIEGNNYFCQDLITLNNPLIGVSSSVFNRTDSEGISQLLLKLKTVLRKYHANWDNLNILNLSINEAGVNYLNNFKSISENDLKKNAGLYFLNSLPNKSNLKKLLNIKLLNFNNSKINWPNYIINQNSTSNTLKPNTFFFNCINLPNNSFFESTGSFYNTEGVLKKNIKFISSKTYTKDDWQILRKLFVNSNKINLLNNSNNFYLINFNLNNFINFKNYIQFLNLATNNLNLKSNTFTNTTKTNIITVNTKFKTNCNKIFETKLKIWINDFYIGGLDHYSKSSITMVNCSKILRAEINNFSHI